MVVSGALFGALPAPADEGMDVGLSNSGLGTLHLAARLGERVDAEFLLDTGSAFVVLSDATRRRLAAEGALVPLRKLRAVLANNMTTSAQVYRLSSLSVGEGCVVRDVEAVVLPGARKDILGLSALRAMAPFTIHLDPLRLHVNCAPSAAPLSVALAD
jgi:predicted aspartyl protease